MKIHEIRALRGPNVHGRRPVIHMLLDLEDLAEVATDKLPGFAPRLLAALPGLAGTPFAESVERGVDLATVTLHVVAELQRGAGEESYVGRASPAKERGVHLLVYRYQDEDSGLEAGREAVAFLAGMLSGKPIEAAECIGYVKEARERNSLGPSTGSIVDEARRRGIPVIRLEDEGSFIQLGHGAHQQRMQATMTGRTASLGVEIADDKERTKRLLAKHGMPVPKGESESTLSGALEVAERIGWPVVVKPLVGNHGRGITVGVRTPEELEAAYELAKDVHRTVLVERMLVGADHRLLVINHTFVAAARRDPAHVVGDGVSTIQQLVDAVNADPRRGEGHEKVMTKIHVDEATVAFLAKQGLAVESVPEAGAKIFLKTTANLSSGGTATDVTDEVHPTVRLMAERISRVVGLDIMGIDVVAPHLRKPLEETGGGICEVNAAPGFRMHLEPAVGRPRNVAAPVLDMLFPNGSKGTVPIVAVTGTNGKTTTVRLITHILRENGARVGMTCTGGVEIQGRPILEGDYSGPGGAEAVLSDPTVDHAVLEVARGGILRRGLGFDECDVGVLLNVAMDHLGEGGVETVDDLARVKGVVLDAVKPTGRAVLNADDPISLAHRARFGKRAILFSLDPHHEAVRAHVEEGGVAVSVVDGEITLMRPGGDAHLAHLRAVPLAFGGKVPFHVQNALAAVAATHALGVPEHVIARALSTFAPTGDQLPGRFNLLDLGKFRVLVDYGHNVPALHALAKALPHLAPGRLINVGSASGNRRDEDLREFGRTLAGMYDHVFVCDPDPRGRPVGATSEIVREGILAGGLPESAVQVILAEDEAVDAALAMAQPGDLVVLQAEDVKGILAKLHDWKPTPVEEVQARELVVESGTAVDVTVSG